MLIGDSCACQNDARARGKVMRRARALCAESGAGAPEGVFDPLPEWHAYPAPARSPEAVRCANRCAYSDAAADECAIVTVAYRAGGHTHQHASRSTAQCAHEGAARPRTTGTHMDGLHLIVGHDVASGGRRLNDAKRVAIELDESAGDATIRRGGDNSNRLAHANSGPPLRCSRARLRC